MSLVSTADTFPVSTTDISISIHHCLGRFEQVDPVLHRLEVEPLNLLPVRIHWSTMLLVIVPCVSSILAEVSSCEGLPGRHLETPAREMHFLKQGAGRNDQVYLIINMANHT